MLLPCEDPVLRAAATQRPNVELKKTEFLPMRVERALTQLLVREISLHIKAENLKRTLEQSYDYSPQGVFRCVDDWNYSYIDKNNLKRFLRQVGVLAKKTQLVSIIRRFDTDGDAKVNFLEFQEGIRSSLFINTGNTSYQSSNKKQLRASSALSTQQKKRIGLTKSSSK